MAENKKVQLNTQSTRASFDPSTFNEEDRTVDVVFATETAVRMYDWEQGEMINEILVCDDTSGDLSRLNNGAPLLDNHRSWGDTADVVVGVVENARFEGGKGIAKVRFSKSEKDEVLMNKVRDGIVTGISVGYNVSEYQVTRSEGQKAEYRATKWEATEISLTPVQADKNSRVRSEDSSLHDVVINEETAAEEVQEEEEENINTNINTEEMAETAQEEPNAEALEQTRSAAAAAERKRISDINGLQRSMKLKPEFTQGLIDEGVSIDTARERSIAEWEKQNPVNAKPQAGAKDEAEKTRSAMANALTLRINPNARKDMGEENVRAAEDFKGMSFLRFAEESLIRSNVKTRGMSSKDIAVAALGGKVRGLHHTTDFPILLLDTINRTLLAQYMQQARTFQAWARRATISDFRPITRARLSAMLGSLNEVKEGEEYTYASYDESGETYKLAKFGKMIGITWEAIVNDDLSAFTRIPQAFAAKAAINQSNIVYKILNDNPNMADGNALFSTQHKNYTGTGTALSETSLDAAYQLFSTQTDEAGDFISVAPRYLVVGPKNRVAAMKLTSANYVPATQTDQPITQSLGLEVIVDPRITDYKWFLIADPSSIDTVEYAFLDGEEELFIDQREGFNIDGVEVKARMVFAAKAIDWRGMYRNNGAAPA